MSWFEIQWKKTHSNSPHLYNELTFHQNFNVSRLRVVKCFFFHRFTNEAQEMTHFPAVKAQVYLLIVHTFHMLMLHLHPDVTKAHNSLSGQHISPLPFLFLQPGHKSFRNLPRRSDPRRSGATCSRAHVGRAPRGGGWRGGRRPQGVGQPGVERETPQPYQACASEWAERKCGSAFQSCFRSDWNSQELNNGTLSVFEQQQLN